MKKFSKAKEKVLGRRLSNKLNPDMAIFYLPTGKQKVLSQRLPQIIL